jgi:hypothetical protein
METALVTHLDKKRSAQKREQNKMRMERSLDKTEGRNVLVYRGVPYVRAQAK